MVSGKFERSVVAEMYPTRGWAKKVDKMSDVQVHAIYLKHIAQQEPKDNDKKEKQ